MTRLPSWQSALDAFLLANQDRPFRYGEWDCCLFACDAIQIMTGVDPAIAYRDKYASRESAMRAVLHGTGRASVQAVAESVTAEYNMPPIPVLQAGRGDLVLIRRSGDYSLGIVALNGREIVTTSSRGLWRLPIGEAVSAWRV
jgi:hypothetical protein